MQKFSTLLLIVCLSFPVFGQQETMPKACTNPGNGILVGGGFSISPQFACLDFSNNSATIFASNAVSPSGGQLSNVGYIFNFKDSDNIQFPTGNPTSTIVSKPGTYWILQGGNEKGAAYVTCKSFEVIQTEQPDIKVSSCGDKSVTVTFLNTPKNQKHGKYRILWGDESQTFTQQINKNSFPFSLQHNYINIPTENLVILAGYTRGNIPNDICRSEPLSIPVIKELPAPENISTVSVDNSNNIKYNILETSGRKAKYLYYKSINGNSFEKVAESIENFYIDKNVDLNKNQYCYAYKYEDICGVQSALSINKNCNVKLSLNNSNLEWTPFSIDTKSKAIPEYTIEGLNEDNSSLTRVGTTTKTNFNILDVWNVIPNNITKFRIQAKITDGIFLSIVYSNSVSLPILSTSKEADSFNIYPNPSEDFVQLNSTLLLKTVEIVDLQGKVIENQSIENSQVSVKHLPKGKYILRLYGNDKKLISSKIIIKM